MELIAHLMAHMFEILFGALSLLFCVCLVWCAQAWYRLRRQRKGRE